MSGPATGDISSDEISAIETEIATIYGVDVSDLETNVDYITSGVLDVVIPEDVSNIDAINALQEAISDVLGLHSSDVLIIISDDNTIIYSITESSFEAANALQALLVEPEFATQLTEDLIESGSDIEVQSSVVNDNVEVVISTTVDTTEASTTIDPVTAIEDLTQHYGLTDSTVQGIVNQPSFLYNLTNIFIRHRYFIIK